ncbi:glycosyltransferase family 2 protein [Chryseolinea sp. T2]|uniref:glycosyltransferase family 2 protein n=1 Tax=Chryseolinea sp. T2 TaxID=3129255 RepID=UPI0030781DD0
MAKPKISIVTPSFNQGKFLERSILSVIDQGYSELEYIVIDGGSLDESVVVLRKYEKYLAYWVSESDRGQSHALNKGLAMATGDIVSWLGADDWYEPGCFENIAKAYAQGTTDILVGDCVVHYANTSKEVLLSPDCPTFSSLLRYWRPQFCPPQPSIFFPRSELDKVGLLDETLHYGMDLDLWLRLSLSSRFRHVSSVLSHYLIHEDSKSGSGFNKFRTEWRMITRKYLSTTSSMTRAGYYFDFYLDRLKRKFRSKK